MHLNLKLYLEGMSYVRSLLPWLARTYYCKYYACGRRSQILYKTKRILAELASATHAVFSLLYKLYMCHVDVLVL